MQINVEDDIVKNRMKVHSYRVGALAFLLLVTVLPVFCQDVSIESKVSERVIYIGEQFELSLEMRAPQGVLFYYPTVNNKSLAPFEIVELHAVDTLVQNNLLTLRQNIILTSFDTGTHTLPALKVAYRQGENMDTASSLPKSIQVNNVPIDLSEDIRDIRPPLGAPFNWGELFGYLYYVFIAFALIGSGLYAWIYYKRNKPEEKTPERSVTIEPAHIIALRELEALRKQDLIRKRQIREYHIRLTDHLRHYIQGRFAVSAMEKTSEEILAGFKDGQTDPASYKALEQILLLADQVKFAKVLPGPQENERSMENAYLFINNTKISSDALPDQ